jgi:hypothetical protein
MAYSQTHVIKSWQRVLAVLAEQKRPKEQWKERLMWGSSMSNSHSKVSPILSFAKLDRLLNTMTWNEHSFYSLSLSSLKQFRVTIYFLFFVSKNRFPMRRGFTEIQTQIFDFLLDNKQKHISHIHAIQCRRQEHDI